MFSIKCPKKSCAALSGKGDYYMEFIMDMVHHNPGETPTKTKFLNSEFLKEFGYNSQVFKHINTAVDFDVCNAEQR